MTAHVHPTNPLADLGALVRARREDRGLSMDQLANAAGVGRSTLFRFEVGRSTAVAPSRVARILVTLGITADEVIPLVHDEHTLGELLAWLDRASQVQALASFAQDKSLRHSDTPAGTPDLVAIHPDGTMLYIEVKTPGEDSERRGGDLVRALGSIGYLVTRPASERRAQPAE